MQWSRFTAGALLGGFAWLASTSGCSPDPLKSIPPPDRVECVEVGSCLIHGPTDDGNDCTTEMCDMCGNVLHLPVPDDEKCKTGNECAPQGRCLAGVCQGTPVADGTACVNLSDPNMCASDPTCLNGVCSSPSMFMCAPNEMCSVGRCLETCAGASWEVVLPSDYAEGLGTADLDGDGFFDLIVADPARDSVIILRNDGGSGNFILDEYNISQFPRAIAVADMDGNGWIDVVVLDLIEAKIYTLSNGGNGTFVSATSFYAGGPILLLNVADLNADGLADLVVGDISDGASVYLNEGNGLFSPPAYHDGGAKNVIADFDGDGHVDIALASAKDQALNVLFNQGDGTFVLQNSYSLDSNPGSIVTADFNGDSLPDIAVLGRYSDLLWIFLNQGSGTFDAKSHPLVAPSESAELNQLVALDGNADGKRDLVVTSHPDAVYWLLNDGNGAFAEPIVYAAVKAPESSTVADFNLDGQQDLAIREENTVRIFLEHCLP